MMFRRTAALGLAVVLAAPALVLAQPAAAPDPRVTPRVTIQQRERPRPMPQPGIEETETVTRSIRIGGNGELVISNLSGDITIKRGGGSDVQIEAVKRARARSQDDAREMLKAVQVDVAERGNRVEVRTVYPGHDRTRPEPHRNVNVSVAYTITAPEGTRVTAKSMSGSIRISDVKGELSAVTMSGQVQISQAGRVASAKSTSGDVEIVNTDADIPLEAGSISGNVVLRQVKAPRIQLNSISGNVTVTDVHSSRIEAHSLSGTVEFASPMIRGGRYDLNSHSGSIRIIVVGGSGFELDGNTFSGAIQADSSLDLKREDEGRAGPRRPRSIRAVFGDGSARIDVRTFSGNVIVTRK